MTRMPTLAPSPPAEPIRLTRLASCAGCAAKLSQTMLAQILGQLSAMGEPSIDSNLNVLVNSSTFDDAGVYQLRPDLALVQTVDFFTPIVDDACDFGQIAAANALSDVYAMGGRPITAMNLLGVPADKLGPGAIAEILRGGAEKVREAGAALVGGHTIKSLEPIYGLSVTGTVHPQRILTNAAARPGDLLVITKPIGTGIVTTAIKRGLASREIAAAATHAMKRLNTVGAELAERSLVGCATDITGFGLTGHLGNVVRASGVCAEIVADDVPTIGPEVLRLIEDDCVPGGTLSNLEAAEALVDWGSASKTLRLLLADAQTSGPLLLCVQPEKMGVVVALLQDYGCMAAVIGRIASGPTEIRVL